MKNILIMMLIMLICHPAQATTVRLETSLGDIDLEMREDVAPLTVQNFLNYVNDGDFNDSTFHRSVPGFILQGGVFYNENGRLVEISQDAAVQNEFNLSNTRGTVAMAKLEGDPNSATSSFFINTSNNASNLDNQNGGFTVFAEVVGDGMVVVDTIASLQRTSSDAPLYNYVSGSVQADNYVYIENAYVLNESFQITPGISGAWVNPDTIGQGFYFEVLPSADTLIMAWFTFDAEAPDAVVPSTVGAASNRWLTASGSFQDNVFVGNLLKTSGGLFDDPTPASNVVVGEVMINFNNCSTAVMSYSLNDSALSNTINIQRISGVNVDFCEQLANEAK